MPTTTPTTQVTIPGDFGLGGNRVTTLVGSSDALPAILDNMQTRTTEILAGLNAVEVLTTISDWLDSVRTATTIALAIAAPGANIDAIAMAAGDRFLAKNQAAPAENGIYTWTGAATPATRVTDFNESAEITAAAAVRIEEGATQAGQVYYISTANPITVDVTGITWTRFNDVDEVSVRAALATLTALTDFNGQAITNVGAVDGRTLSTDGAKLDLIEAAADVTDAVNVIAALAANAVDVALNAQNITGVGTVDGRTLATDGAKLDLIEAAADVTDAVNVIAALAANAVDVALNAQDITGAGTYNGHDLAGTALSRYTVAADSQLTGDGMGATTETAHTAVTLTSADLATARRLVKFRGLLFADSDNGADTWTAQVRLGGIGGTVVATLAAFDLVAAGSVWIEGEIVIRTTGAGGTFHSSTRIHNNAVAVPIDTVDFTAAGGVDTDVTNDLVVTGESSSNNAGMQVTLRSFSASVFTE